MDTDSLLVEISQRLEVIASNQGQLGLVLMAFAGLIMGFWAAKELLEIWTP